MPDLKEVRVSHPAMSFIKGDTFATLSSLHASYLKPFLRNLRKSVTSVSFMF